MTAFYFGDETTISISKYLENQRQISAVDGEPDEEGYIGYLPIELHIADVHILAAERNLVVVE